MDNTNTGLYKNRSTTELLNLNNRLTKKAKTDMTNKRFKSVVKELSKRILTDKQSEKLVNLIEKFYVIKKIED